MQELVPGAGAHQPGDNREDVALIAMQDLLRPFVRLLQALLHEPEGEDLLRFAAEVGL